MNPAPRRDRLGLAAAVACGLLSFAAPLSGQDLPAELPTCSSPSAPRIEGVVVDLETRVPLPGASVASVRGGVERRVPVSAEGRFRICDVSAETSLQLRASYRAVTGPFVTAAGRVDPEPVTLRLDLGAPSAITVRVTDGETGDPVEGVTLRLQPSVIGGVTNETGTTGFGLVPPGEYRLRADHIAYAQVDGEVFIDPGRDRELSVALNRRIIALDTLNVTVRSEGCARPGYTTVTGTVVDRRTRLPMEGAIVTASRFEDERLRSERAQSGENGQFFLCGLPLATRYLLQAELGDLRSEGETIETGEERGAIVLEIDHGRPAHVAFRVIDADTGFPVEGAMIRLRPHPLAGITTADGNAGFREVPPGEYEIRVDHIAYASHEGTIEIGEQVNDEFEIRLRTTAIAMEPLEVRVTGRDPTLINTGFYDRMATLEEGSFYDYWDFEPFALMSTFLSYKTFLTGRAQTFVNGRPLRRSGYMSVNEIPFSEIRGVEHIRCADLPKDLQRYFPAFSVEQQRTRSDCWAVLIWRGEGRVRQQRTKPEGRCADERRAELTCANKGGG